MNKAVFLDRDGTINEDRHYVHTTDDFVLLPKVPEAISLMRRKGYLIVIITNQSGVARGFFSETDVVELNKHMQRELQKKDADIDAVYFCPHLPNGNVKEYAKICRCRKPGTLMFERGIYDFNIDPKQSYAVGDKLRDLEPGKKLGMKTVLISHVCQVSDIVDAVYPGLYDFAVTL